jgi:bifunctional DNA-binding transcriptional regulator/antitoxin component of YhaV-PrlF toxin-antitoxin module
MPADITSLVRVKANFQVTLPLALCRRFRISEGDVLEASATKLGILLKPKAVVDDQTTAS